MLPFRTLRSKLLINETEDEVQFLLRCICYNDLRRSLTKAIELRDDFSILNDSKKLVYLMEHHYVCMAKYIVVAMNKRKLSLYTSN